jgi:hypothetical protein
MIWTSNANLWAVAGTVYALAGAVLLCYATFHVPRPSRAGTTAYDLDVRRLNEQWLDTRIGVVLLAVGFFLQATGALGTATLNGPAAIVLLGLAFAAVVYAMMRSSIVERMIEADKVPAREPASSQHASAAHVANAAQPAPAPQAGIAA